MDIFVCFPRFIVHIGSMSTSSDEEWVQPSVAKTKRKSSQQGESNLKGFASAFATIMERPETASTLTKPLTEKAQEPTLVKKPREEKVVVGHIKQPVVGSNDVRESHFEEIAKRGVVKLFRAVAMHKKRALENEASKGIGVTKNGQIRRRRIPSSKPTGESEGRTKSMASFLDALKKAKTPPSV